MADSRASQAAMAAELGVPPFVVQRIVRSAMGYDIPRLQKAYLLCIHQEYLVKSGQLNEEGSLEQLVLALIALRKEAGRKQRA